MKKLLLLLCALSISFTVFGGSIEKKVDKLVDTVHAVNKISATVRNTVVSEDTEELLNLLTEYAINKGKAKVQDKVDDFINKKITGEREKALLQQAFAKLGKEQMTVQDLTDVTLAFQTSALKQIINKNLGSHEAQLACEALDKLVTEGADGALNVGQNELNRLIDKYVKGDAAKESLKDAVQKIRDNKIDEIDVGKVTKDVTQGAINNWIDKQDWNESQKKKAKELVDAGLTDGVDGVTEYAKQKIIEKVGKELGEDAGKAMQNIINQVIDYDQNKESIQSSISTITHSAMVKAIEKQYDKICKKYPVLGKIMDFFGIKDTVLNAAANIKQLLANAKSIKQVIFGIAGIAVDMFKQIANNIITGLKTLLNGVINQLGNIAKKLMQKALQMLTDMAKKITQKIINEMINFVKKLTQRITALTKKIVYVINEVKSNIKMIVDNAEKIRENIEGAIRIIPVPTVPPLKNDKSDQEKAEEARRRAEERLNEYKDLVKRSY